MKKFLCLLLTLVLTLALASCNQGNTGDNNNDNDNTSDNTDNGNGDNTTDDGKGDNTTDDENKNEEQKDPFAVFEDAVFFFDFRFQFCIAITKPFMNIAEGIRPDMSNVTIFPIVRA